MLKTTALHQEHIRLGAHMTDFAGWDMPLRYDSELSEHEAVRQAAGMFDLSHMGEIFVTGPDAVSLLETVFVGKFAAMKVGKAKYSLCCNEAGGIIDDLITYRLADAEFLVVPNASNVADVLAALQGGQAGHDAQVRDATAETAMIAVQGPAAASIVESLADPSTSSDVAKLAYYAATWMTLNGARALLARTGYTGEDGFEIMVAGEVAVPMWNALLEAGQGAGLIPAGLASRDSLRLEAGMPLHGNELSAGVDPFMANLGRVVAVSKDDFVGREALVEIKELTADDEHAARAGRRRLVGLKGRERRAARPGSAVLHSGEFIGEITSGQPSPTLGYPIAMGYLDVPYGDVGDVVDVDIRGKSYPFEVVDLPFYRRATR